MAAPKLAVVEETVRLCLPDVTGMTLATAALTYAQAGWFVFPVRPNSKKPAVGDWDAQSTRDPKRIAAWWKRNPRYGIALHVGKSGAVAFDFDHLTFVVLAEAGRDDIADALANAGGINGTRKPEISTERAHYLFACEIGEFSNSAGDFGPYGEVRGNNGYIVVAPTPHPDVETKGGEYWQIRTGELTPVPAVLRAMLAAPGKVADPLSYAEFEAWLNEDDDGDEKTCGVKGCKHSVAGLICKFTAKVDAGASRYETMTKDIGPWGFREAVAGCYRKRAVLKALEDAYQQVKPGERNELYRAMRWAAAQAQADPGDPHPDKATADAQTQLNGLVTAAQLDSMVFAPLVEHVPHLITEGFGILAGPPKAGKSWMTASLALACAHGGTALGSIPVQQRHVLLLALEDGHRRLQSRMRRLNGELPLPERLHILTTVNPGTIIAVIREWLSRHANDPNPPLVILDTLGRAREQRKSGDDPYIADYQLGATIKGTVDAVAGAALVAVHHTRKMGAEDWIDTVSGTQGITGSADYILVLRRKRKSDEGTLAVTGRDVAEAEYAIRADAGVWTLDGKSVADAAAVVSARDDRGRLGDRSFEVMKVVAAQRITTPGKVAKHLGIDSDVAGKYLRRLVDAGHLTKRGRGSYALVSVDPVSEVSEVSEPEQKGSSEVVTTGKDAPSEVSEVSETTPHVSESSSAEGAPDSDTSDTQTSRVSESNSCLTSKKDSSDTSDSSSEGNNR